MLTPQPALTTRPSKGCIGVALAGGGPLGAFFEFGALHALDESVEGLDLNDLDVYVGVSSGSLIAASLVNGLSTMEMGRIFINNESEEFPMTPGLLVRPAMDEYLHRAASIPGLLTKAIWEYARHPLRQRLVEVLNPLNRAIPTGLFDNHAIEEFLSKLYSAPGRTNDFRELKHQLYVVATDLNSGHSVKFGAKGYNHVPISRAVQASAALPGLFPPVLIDDRSYVDGALRRTMNASLALDAGADFVICINPLVPFDASRAEMPVKHDNLVEGGLLVVLSQTFRALIQSRMQVGMAKYEDSYPEADVLLFEPDPDDEEMFFANVFSYADRQRLVDHAYQRTRKDLLRHARKLAPILARHGLTLRTDVLKDPDRTFQTQIEAQRRREKRSRVGNELSDTLEELRGFIRNRES